MRRVRPGAAEDDLAARLRWLAATFTLSPFSSFIRSTRIGAELVTTPVYTRWSW